MPTIAPTLKFTEKRPGVPPHQSDVEGADAWICKGRGKKKGESKRPNVFDDDDEKTVDGDPLVPTTSSMKFCPHDGTLLQVHVEDKGTPVAKLMFFCPLCTYIDRPKGRQKFQVQLQKKVVEEMLTFRETRIREDDDDNDRRRLGGWGVLFRTKNSVIPLKFSVPRKYIQAFIKGKRFPPVNIYRYIGQNKDIERGPRTKRQLELMHHLVKKGMCWPKDLAGKVEKLARKDDKYFSKA